MERTKNDCCTTSVGCNVTNCKHHTGDNHCDAPQIKVQNETACNKADTFCSTFAPKAGC